jgi:Ca-activated chloride channel family protein
MKKIDTTSTENIPFDTFTVPENLWTRVEDGLNEKKSKRRGIIWWRIAAGFALLIGIGALVFASFNRISTPNNQLKAQNNVIVGDSIPEKVDSSEYTFNKIEPLPFATRDAGPRMPVNDGVNGSVNIQTQQNASLSPITTTVPFVNMTAGGRSGAMGQAGNPFSSGGTSGSGTGLAPNAFTPNLSGFATSSQSLFFTSRRAPQPQGKLKFRAVTQQENINRLNYRRDDYIDYLDGDIESSIYYDSVSIDGMPDFSDLYPTTPESYETGRDSAYDDIVENEYLEVLNEPQSTFSIDVDGASYSDVRGAINRKELPMKNAVRLEEFVNYFPYDYAEPTGEHPFSIHTELAACPWNSEHKLMKIGIKGQSIEKQDLPRNNLVFLLDVSGSMESVEKLELLKKGFRLLVSELRETDRVSIAVYAGAAGLVLPPTSGQNKDKILDALDCLSAGGSTAGGEGILLAYKTAEEYFDKNGNNRVILATDGDFNVGVSGDDALVKLIEEKRKTGVFLTVLGFGHDNFQSSKMEKIANNGNGNFSFIDNILEAKKVLVTEMGATLLTIAKDVKIQVEFNPTLVGGYRLLGYENRMLENADFANDTVDAGELGAGHTVTAVYEIIPPVADEKASYDRGLKYSQTNVQGLGIYTQELATVKFRYKEPTGTTSKLIESVVLNSSENKPSDDFEFVQAVLEFGLVLRESEYRGTANFEHILEQAERVKGDDPYGYRKEFIRIVEQTRVIWNGENIE